jgi:uncharacterized membrane protein YhaH (DUF805 family)
MDSYLGPLLFGFQGRINRAKYWIAAIVYTSLMIAIFGLGFFFNFNMLFLAFAAMIFVAIIVSGFAVGIKRLHDRDKSGWWLLAFYFVPPLLDGVGRAIGSPLIFELASIAVSIWAIVELGFMRGTSGPNQYGPDPLATQ